MRSAVLQLHTAIEDILNSWITCRVLDVRPEERSRRSRSKAARALRKMLFGKGSIGFDTKINFAVALGLINAQALLIAFGRVWELTDAEVNRLGVGLDHAESLMVVASQKYREFNELLRKGDVSSGTLANLVKSTSSDLDSIREIIEGDNWEDRASMREYERVMAAIGSAMDNTRRKLR